MRGDKGERSWNGATAVPEVIRAKEVIRDVRRCGDKIKNEVIRAASHGMAPQQYHMQR